MNGEHRRRRILRSSFFIRDSPFRLSPKRAIALAGVWIVVAPSAQAHLMNTGLGPFYDGILHLLMTPGDLLLLLALSLFAGLRGAAPGRWVLFALPASWMAGGIAGLQAPGEISMPAVATLVLIATGVLVASDVHLPQGVVVALAIAAGSLQGLLNGSAMASTGAGLRGLAGIGCAAFVVVALVAALAVKSARAGRGSRCASRGAGSPQSGC